MSRSLGLGGGGVLKEQDSNKSGSAFSISVILFNDGGSKKMAGGGGGGHVLGEGRGGYLQGSHLESFLLFFSFSFMPIINKSFLKMAMKSMNRSTQCQM